MTQGLQIWNQNSDLIFDTNDRMGRVIYCGPANASGCPNGSWSSPLIASTYPGTLWAILMPLYPIDNSTSNQLYSKAGQVSVGTATNHPGCLFVSGNWYDSQTSVTTDYPYQNSILIYGVY